MWSDYLPPDFIAEFEKSSGIKVNHTGIGSNEEIIKKMKGTKGRGFDIISPTNVRSPQWKPLELVQPFDMNRVDTSTVNPAMLRIGEVEWNFDGKGTHWLPHIWGTEAIAWRTDKWSLPDRRKTRGEGRVDMDVFSRNHHDAALRCRNAVT